MAKSPAKKPKAAKKPKPAPKPKAAKAPKAEKAPKVAKEQKKFNTLTDPQEKALLLHHLPKVVDARTKIATATSALRTLYKTAKADGFTKADFDDAIAFESAEAEAKEKAKIARKLRIARLMGADLGHQLDLFLEPVRVPAVDRAYEEGQTDSMSGKSANPSYDPSTEQYRKYMDGFNDHQAQRIAGGIKKLEPETGTKVITKAEKEAAAAKAAPAPTPAKTAPAPLAGVPTTRSQFIAQQAEKAKAKEEGNALFTKKAEGTA